MKKIISAVAVCLFFTACKKETQPAHQQDSATQETFSARGVKRSTSPVVTIVTPVNNATVSGITTVTANVTGATGTTEMLLLINGILQDKKYTSVFPFSFQWTTSYFAGSTVPVQVIATDANGKIGLSNIVNVTVR